MEKEIVIITGAGGFIGSSLIKKIAEKYDVVGFDRSAGKDSLFGAQMIEMDITSEESVDKGLKRIKETKGNKIASVIHLAAYYNFSGKPSPLYEKLSVQGTERLIKKFQYFEVGQFVFSSSMLVYRPTQPGKKITEESPLEPKWAYPESKVKTEKVLFENKGDIPVVSLRVAGVYNDEGNSIPIVNHIQRIYEKQITAYFFPGETSHGNAFIHLDDLINAIGKAIDKRKEFPKELILNISEEETLSYQEMQEIISGEIHGKEMGIIKIAKEVAKLGAYVQDLSGDAFIKPWMIDIADDHYEMDCSKAKILLDWQPKHSLRETLPVIIAGLKKDPVAWYKKNKLKVPQWLEKQPL